MITNIKIRNFKKFEDINLDIGLASVFVGPNNSGKTSALQALSLWQLGLKKWIEKRGNGPIPKKRSGIPINRLDLLNVPVGITKLLWKNKNVRKGSNTNIRIEIIVEGISRGKQWNCGLEFDFANDEAIICRPINAQTIPDEALLNNIVFLPPMSGLSSEEDRLESGSINSRIGQGLTAEVLRNLCLQLYEKFPDKWEQVKKHLKLIFGVIINNPIYKQETGKIFVTYTELDNTTEFDLASSGRGMHQTLLLTTWLYLNPESILLLDEPDAHLEFIRQKQIYDILVDTARNTNGQIISASHSEIIMNQAGDKDVLIAFVGKPHRIDDRGTQTIKSLKEIGFDQYYQAELHGAVLYMEGANDLKILSSFAQKLNHSVYYKLNKSFVSYVGNQYKQAARHFFGLKEAKADLKGYVILDRQGEKIEDSEFLPCYQWKRNEIENYLCFPKVLISYAQSLASNQNIGPLFDETKKSIYEERMNSAIENRVPKAALLNMEDSFWKDTKVSDNLLPQIFDDFFKSLELKNIMPKSDFYVLATHVSKDLIDDEIKKVLDEIEKIL